MSFFKQRLSDANLASYVKSRRRGGAFTSACRRVVPGVPILIQNRFGRNNCSICAMTCLIAQRAGGDAEQLYPLVEKKAGRLFYRPKGRGTNPFAIRWMLRRASKAAGIDCRSRAAFLKDVGFGWKRLMSLIDSGTPFALSFHHDGNRYYHSHTVTVAGYAVYRRPGSRSLRLLIIHDGWNGTVSYLDYEKLSIFSSVNYLA